MITILHMTLQGNRSILYSTFISSSNDLNINNSKQIPIQNRQKRNRL